MCLTNSTLDLEHWIEQVGCKISIKYESTCQSWLGLLAVNKRNRKSAQNIALCAVAAYRDNFFLRQKVINLEGKEITSMKLTDLIWAFKKIICIFLSC